MCEYLIGIGASPRDVAAHLEHCDLPALVPDTYRQARDEAGWIWLLAEARRWAELAGGDEDDVVALAELEQQLGLTHAAEGRLRELSGTDVERLLGRIAFETGRPAEAIEHLLAAERAGADGAGIEWPLTMALSTSAGSATRGERAEALLAADDPWVRVDALANLGVVEVRDGRLDRAAEALEAARSSAADLGDALRLAHVTGDLAGVAVLLRAG